MKESNQVETVFPGSTQDGGKQICGLGNQAMWRGFSLSYFFQAYKSWFVCSDSLLYYIIVMDGQDPASVDIPHITCQAAIQRCRRAFRHGCHWKPPWRAPSKRRSIFKATSRKRDSFLRPRLGAYQEPCDITLKYFGWHKGMYWMERHETLKTRYSKVQEWSKKNLVRLWWTPLKVCESGCFATDRCVVHVVTWAYGFLVLPNPGVYGGRSHSVAELKVETSIGA